MGGRLWGQACKAAKISWLSSAVLLACLSNEVKPARRLFADFVLNQRGLGHCQEFHEAGCKDARVFGADVFLNEVLNRAEETAPHRPDLATTLNLVVDYFERNLDHLRLPGQGREVSRLRAFAAWAVLELSRGTLAELGVWLGRGSSSLSSAVRRLLERAKRDDRLKYEMTTLQEQLTKFATL